MDNCYVYVYKDEGGVPRYIGKGRNDRMNEHIALAAALNQGRRQEKATHFTRWLAKCLRTGRRFSCEIVQGGMSDEAAFDLEKRLIAEYKRCRESGGSLYNTLSGGDGFTSEDAKRISNDPAVKAAKSAGVRKAFTDPEMRARLAAATRESNGRPHRREQARQKAMAEWRSEERKSAASQRAKELWADPEWAARQREAIARRQKR